MALRRNKANWCELYYSVKIESLWNPQRCTYTCSYCSCLRWLPLTMCWPWQFKTQIDHDTKSCSDAFWSSRMLCHLSCPCNYRLQSTIALSNWFRRRFSVRSHSGFLSVARLTFVALIRLELWHRLIWLSRVCSCPIINSLGQTQWPTLRRMPKWWLVVAIRFHWQMETWWEIL